VPSPTPFPPRRPGSVLPQRILPQTTIWGRADKDGNVTIDVDWWLFLLSVSSQVLSGPTSPVPITPADNIALLDGQDVVSTDALPAPQAITNAVALATQDMELARFDAAGFPIRINNAQLLQLDQDVAPTLRDMANALVLAMDAMLPDPVGIFGGVIQATGSPLIKTGTRAVTAISGVKPSNSQSTSNTLAADTDLTLTFNEIGTYALDGYLSFYETTLGTGGFQFDFNSGSATVGAINFGVDGYVTAAVGNAGVTSVSTATSFGTVVTSSSAPSWLRITGYLTITAIGTFALRWAQAATLAIDPTNLLAGSRIMATKIG